MARCAADRDDVAHPDAAVTPDPFTDREYHKTAPVPATGRPSIYEFRQPKRDWLKYMFEHYIVLPRAGRVLDAGCGPGAYIPAARDVAPGAVLIALDIAAGRLAHIDRAKAVRVAADVTALPLLDCSIDVVLAMHMLYHVPHVPDAVAEFHRVLRGGGVLYAFTNSERSQSQLTELYERHGGGSGSAMGDPHFSNESGRALLETSFSDVTLTELRDSELVVTDPECVVDEFQRLRYALEPHLVEGTAWDDFVDATRSDVTAMVERDGTFRISECHGLFVCRRP
ncbi:MAG: class I SAM-dependent methyltransferase [Actinobacteria bacterium]|nr:class I SAM-dependent methyltransferase [Actinomycetota bacterium]